MTRSVNRVEAALGTKLFMRTSKGLRANARGCRTIVRVMAMMGHIEAAAFAACVEIDITPSYVAGYSARVTASNIRAILSLHASGDVSAAAVRLGVSEAAIAMALHDAELRLGLQIVRRSGLRLQMTRQALAMMPELLKALDILRSIETSSEV